MESLKHRMEVAAEAAWQGGKLTLRYFQRPLAVETKADQSPVTAADRECEVFLAEFLRREFPADGFLGEEHGERRGTSGFRWIIDPIDGTKTFVHGVPLYSVLVGLEGPEGESVVGAIALPGLGELVCAARGEGTYWNGRRARVSSLADLAGACVLYTGMESFVEAGALAAWDRVRPRVRLLRGWGDAYGHVLVATGRADGMLDPVLSLWDCAALQPIVEEAGGVFTDWNGKPTIHGRSAISTNRGIAAELRDLARGAPPRPA